MSFGETPTREHGLAELRLYLIRGCATGSEAASEKNGHGLPDHSGSYDATRNEGASPCPLCHPSSSPSGSSSAALLPDREVDHPLGCHRSRIPDRVVFEKLVVVPVFGCAYWRIAEEVRSATTIRRRRDEWMEAGVMDALERMAPSSYDRAIGLELSDVSVDGCITKSPAAARNRAEALWIAGKGIKRSTAVDAGGIPRRGRGRANRHDSRFWPPPSTPWRIPSDCPRMREFTDRAYDSKKTRQLLEERAWWAWSTSMKPAPLTAGLRWIVERTNSWHNAHKKLVWCTEREELVIDFWISFSNADHRGTKADPGSLESLSLGGQTCSMP